MAFSAKRKFGAKRRAKKAAGLEGLIPSFLPEVPSVRSILRQLLTGLFRSTGTTKRIVKKEYEFTVKGRKQYKQDLQRAFDTAATQTTIQSALHVLGEIIYSTPIITSALAQAWKLSTRRSNQFNPSVTRMNHEAVFAKARAEASPEMQRVIKSAKKLSDREVDLYVTNSAPYIEDARPAAYWRSILNNAWARQARVLQKTFSKNAKRLGLTS